MEGRDGAEIKRSTCGCSERARERAAEEFDNLYSLEHDGLAPTPGSPWFTGIV